MNLRVKARPIGVAFPFACRRVVRVPSARKPVVMTTPVTLRPLDADYETIHAFASFSNWIVPERLMVGRYPYVEPGESKKCRTHEVGEAQLKKIVQAGIRTFSDVRSQEEMPVGGDKGFLPYKQPVELIVEAMAGPPPKETFEGIRNPFLDRFLPKSQKSEGENGSPSMECKFVHHPIQGLKVLTAEELDPVLADLEKRLNEGENIYMHCWGGRGRAGIVSCCLLAKMFGLTAEECIERVSRAWQTRKDETYPSALSDEHIAFVHKFAEYAKV